MKPIRNSSGDCPNEKQRALALMKELEKAYTAQANDPEFQEEMMLWDVTVKDGLNAE